MRNNEKRTTKISEEKKQPKKPWSSPVSQRVRSLMFSMSTWTNTSSICHSNCREDHMLLLGRCQRFFPFKDNTTNHKIPSTNHMGHCTYECTCINVSLIFESSFKKNTTKNNSEAYHMKQKHINVLHYHNILCLLKRCHIHGDPHSQHRS